jgi:hypothetical protein
VAKPELKKKAVALRKEGKSYREILSTVPVSKGSLSHWLRDIPLSEEQICRLKSKIDATRERASQAVSRTWAAKRLSLLNSARNTYAEIQMDKTSLALIGTALYWAEGTSYNLRYAFVFTNSDPNMLILYIRWLKEILGAKTEDIVCRINVYLNNELSYKEIRKYWSNILGIPSSSFTKPCINSKPKSSRVTKKNKLPYGVVQVKVKRAQRFLAKYVALAEKLGANVADEFIG